MPRWGLTVLDESAPAPSRRTGYAAAMASLLPPQHPALVGLVTGFWRHGPRRKPAEVVDDWEIALPSGTTHLAMRPNTSIRIRTTPTDERRHPGAVIAGPRAGAYRRDVAPGTVSVGLMLTPWALPTLFGCSALELRDQHVDLEQLLGGAARPLEDALAEAGAQARVEAALLRTLRPGPGRGLIRAIEALQRGMAVADAATQRGCSERHFRDEIRSVTGYSPREISRLARLQTVLRLVQHDGGQDWATRAARAGYADQPHLCRELKALTGLTPTELVVSLPAAQRVSPTRRLASTQLSPPASKSRQLLGRSA